MEAEDSAKLSPLQKDPRSGFSRGVKVLLRLLLLLIYMGYCLWLVRHYKMNIANLSGLTEIRFGLGASGILLSSLCLWVFGSPFAWSKTMMAAGCLLICAVLLFPFWQGSWLYSLHLLSGFGGSLLYLFSILKPLLFWFTGLSPQIGQKERQACFGLVVICLGSVLIWAWQSHISGHMELFFCLCTAMYFYTLDPAG